jgi:hypothetical protein
MGFRFWRGIRGIFFKKNTGGGGKKGFLFNPTKRHRFSLVLIFFFNLTRVFS